MNSHLKIEELPDEIKKEVFDYAEYLLEKYKQKKRGGNNRWLKTVDRGTSKDEMASETIEKMRKEEKW